MVTTQNRPDSSFVHFIHISVYINLYMAYHIIPFPIPISDDPEYPSQLIAY